MADEVLFDESLMLEIEKRETMVRNVTVAGTSLCISSAIWHLTGWLPTFVRIPLYIVGAFLSVPTSVRIADYLLKPYKEVNTKLAAAVLVADAVQKTAE